MEDERKGAQIIESWFWEAQGEMIEALGEKLFVRIAVKLDKYNAKKNGTKPKLNKYAERIEE